MNRIQSQVLIMILLSAVMSISCNRTGSESYTIDPGSMNLVGEVDERYQSVNIEMCEVVGGDFWIPYELLDPARVTAEGIGALKYRIPPADLYEKKLRTLATALGPMYIRVSGTWANSTYFQDNDEPKLASAPEGYENVLTRAEWKGVIDFCKAVDAKLVTSFAISDGIRDNDGNWKPAQMGPLVDYTKSIGGEITAAEMFNEPSHASYGGAPEGYNASWFARDFAAFKQFADSAVPEMIILGPGSTGEGGILGDVGPMSTDSILSADPLPEFEILSYHYYGGVSRRCGGQLTPEYELTEEWLGKTEQGLSFYEEARDQYMPGAHIWLTETAEAACGGNPWASTYVDCFRYLEQLGRLAKKGVQVVMHNTLAASEYALLDHDTHDPRPNYWVALLWSRLMGTTVYDAGEITAGVDIFAHNSKQYSKGVSVMIINTLDSSYTVNTRKKARQYLLTADEIQAKKIKLNSEELVLTAENELPEIEGVMIKAGTVVLPPYSILFIVFNKK